MLPLPCHFGLEAAAVPAGLELVPAEGLLLVPQRMLQVPTPVLERSLLTTILKCVSGLCQLE